MTLVLWLVVGLSISGQLIGADQPVWEWKCINEHCQKTRTTTETQAKAMSLEVCQITCLKYGTLWPQPTGDVSISKDLVPVNKKSIKVIRSNTTTEDSISRLIKAIGQIFKNNIAGSAAPRQIASGGKDLVVIVQITDQSVTQLTLETDESYALTVKQASDGRVNATIVAPTYFGSRHGLETLHQLIIFDDFKNQLMMPNEVAITDKPVYPYRGILLDTARNYISVATIKRAIDGIAASKLNTLHWHMTDSQSFPYVSKSQPQLSKFGAYSSSQVYTPANIEDILKYAKERGVRVLPEFDAPAHVGEGWQNTSFVVCFNQQPWQNFCSEPPCGQFDPTKPALYEALEGLYKDMIEQFKPDLFHMGGDEVSTECWQTSNHIVDWMKSTHEWGASEKDFINLWNEFQGKALQRLDKNLKSKIPIIMWTSTLTESQDVETFLPKDRYIIQVWTKSDDEHIQALLRKGYRLILSNFDALYLDCGYGGWTEGGNNWCTPYKGWQTIYDNSPAKIGGDRKKQFLGGEAALWTEQVDDSSVDDRLWPRAAALAERLWAEPSTSWSAAESRILVHKERLKKRGIGVEGLQPMWCMQYDNNCPVMK